MRLWKILNFELVRNIFDRRRDHVTTTRPFAEIDQTAALAAEREVLGCPCDWLLARGAFQVELALAGHELIVDGTAPAVERSSKCCHSEPL